jgi:uncharacterized protein involved in outer membrane biogenesis
MLTRKRLLVSTGGLALLLLLFISLVLPGIIVDRAQDWVSAETGRALEIGSLSINPLSLTIEIDDLSLSETDLSTAFLSWQKLRVSLSPASLFRLAPIIRQLQLDQPYLRLERHAGERFNFSDLLPPEGPEEPTTASKEPAHFSLNNLTINNGRIELFDNSLDQEVHHTIEELQLALPSIGNLSYMVEDPVQPLLHALVNDSPIDIKGEFKPFTQTQEMQFNLALENIDLPFYLAYVPVELPIKLRNGRLSFDLDLLYRAEPDKTPELQLSGRLDLASLDIWDRQDERLFFLPLLQVELGPSHLLTKDIHLNALRIYNLEVELQRDKSGIWNHSRLKMAEESSPEPEPEPAEESTVPFKLLIDTVEIRDGVVLFRDNQPDMPFATTAKEINIDIIRFSLDAAEPIPLALSLKTPHEESVKVTGDFLLSPLTLNLQAELHDLLMAAYEPYYHETYAGPLGGRLSLKTDLKVSPEQSLLVENGGIEWLDAYMAFNEQEGLAVDRIAISGFSFDLDKMRLEIEQARYHDGRVNFSRSPDGHWSLLSRNFPILAKLAEAAKEKPSIEPESVGPAFNYRIGELSVIDWQFDIEDRLPATAVQLQAKNFTLNFHNLAAPDKVESPFYFSTTFQEKGQILLKGTASLADQAVKLNTQLKRIDLAAFAPYLSEQANLVLSNGALFANLSLAVAPGDETMQIRYGGDIGINRFALLDGKHREDLLKWDSLQVAGISGATAPSNLTIDSITLSDYYAKILVDENAKLNLSEAFSKEEDDQQRGESATEPPAADEPIEEEGPATDIRIGTVTLQGGQVDFTDRNLPQPFHADMRELGGRIQGLSSDIDTQADVDLRGSLRNQSPLSITGTLNPLAEKLRLDLKLSFRDIELSPLSPYSGTYVGHVIEKGKLNLDLEYHIAEDHLQANNKVFLDQFTFGDSVESDKATGLPVKLAVALLKDRDGEIHLDIPVSGSLDDPEFRIGSVIWTVIKNLLVKAATSPMALLGALLGGGDEDFSSINFAYGSSRLPPPEQEKLDKMAAALLDRPSLDIEVKGFIDPENDPEGYRHEQLRMQIQRTKFLDLVDREDLPEGMTEQEIVVTDEEYPDYLWQVYKEAPFPKPRNFIGMTKELPPQEMEKLIYANTPVGPEQLEQLAQTRALVVQNILIEQGGLPRERVFLTKPDIMTEPGQEGGSRSRVEFGITVR